MGEILERIGQGNKNFSESEAYGFAESFNIEKGDIVAFTGGGGKTSLIFKLAEELRGKGRICITTTTKMSIPQESEYENLIIKNGQRIVDSEVSKESKKENRELDLAAESAIISKFPEENRDMVFKGKRVGIDFYATGIDYKKDKITGDLEKIDFSYLKERYDYIFVEADGSRGRSIKFWKADEPCIPNAATKVVGVFNIKSLGKKIGDAVLRAENFCDEYNGKIGSDNLKSENLRRESPEIDAVLNKLTLESSVDQKLVEEYLGKKKFFRVFHGENSEKKFLIAEEMKTFLFINGIESLEEFNSALKISNRLSSANEERCFEEEKKDTSGDLASENTLEDEKILFGSILKNEIYPYQRFSAILMASGYSRRLGKNKLLMKHNEKNLLDIIMEKIEGIGFFDKNLVISQENLDSYVENIEKELEGEPDRAQSKLSIDSNKNSGYNQIVVKTVEKLQEKMGESSKVVINGSPEMGQSYSMKLGIEKSQGLYKDLSGNGREFYAQEGNYMFFPCDQPFIREETILQLMKKHLIGRSCQVTLPWINNHGTSPTIFSDSLREKLLNVQGDIGGRDIIKSCDWVERVEFGDKEEFHDIDREDDLKFLKNILS